MHHGSTEIIKDTTEESTTCLEKDFLKVINIQINGAFQKKNNQKSTENKLHSVLYNNSPHFAWYGQNPSIHKLRNFGCYKHPIISSPKNLDDKTK